MHNLHQPQAILLQPSRLSWSLIGTSTSLLHISSLKIELKGSIQPDSYQKLSWIDQPVHI